MQFDKKYIEEQLANLFSQLSEKIADPFFEYLNKPAEEIVKSCELILDKPYGKNNIIFQNSEFGLSFLQMNPNQSTSLHYHNHRREFFCVRKGVLSLQLDEAFREIKAFNCAHSIPGKSHSLSNKSQELLEILEVFSPPLLNDKVRVSDTYGRSLGEVTYDK